MWRREWGLGGGGEGGGVLGAWDACESGRRFYSLVCILCILCALRLRHQAPLLFKRLLLLRCVHPHPSTISCPPSVPPQSFPPDPPPHTHTHPCFVMPPTTTTTTIIPIVFPTTTPPPLHLTTPPLPAPSWLCMARVYKGSGDTDNYVAALGRALELQKAVLQRMRGEVPEAQQVERRGRGGGVGCMRGRGGRERGL